jgi:hypothetical protein
VARVVGVEKRYGGNTIEINLPSVGEICFEKYRGKGVP